MRELITSLLDALGLLLFAAGIAAAVHPWIGWASLAVAGVVILGGSFLSSSLTSPRKGSQ